MFTFPIYFIIKYMLKKAHTAKRISRKSHTGGVKEPEKVKSRFEILDAMNPEANGKRTEETGVILMLILERSRKNERRKLYPSIITITSA